MEIIFLSFVAIVAIAGYQIVEHLADHGRQGAPARASDPLSVRRGRIAPTTKTLAPEQQFDKAA